MKLLATTLIGTFVIVLFASGEKPMPELPDKSVSKVYTQQEIIQQTDIYKQSVRIEDTLNAINIMLIDIKYEKTDH